MTPKLVSTALPADAIALLDRGTAAPKQDHAQNSGVRAKRLTWLDTAKGLGIVLVVLGHAAGGLIDMNEPQLSWLHMLMFAIYTFHMPLFFLLSAVLVPARIMKGRPAFARSIVERIVYPYVIWSILQLTVIYLAGSLVNAPVNDYWTTILSLPWHAVSQFWFLYSLAILHLLAMLLPSIGAWGFVAMMVVGRILAQTLPIEGILGQTLLFGVFYGFGLVLNAPRLTQLRKQRPWMAAVGVGVLLLALPFSIRVDLLPLFQQDPRPSAGSVAGAAWELEVLPMAVLGTAVTIGLAMGLKGPLAAGLAYMGRNSMPIFLAHVIFVAGTRIVLWKLFGPIDLLSLLLLLTAIGLIGPLLLRWIAMRLGVAKILALQ